MQLPVTALLVVSILASTGASSSIDRDVAAEELNNLQLLQTALKTEISDDRAQGFRCAPIEKIWDESGLYQKAGICGPPEIRLPTLYDKTKWYPGSPAEADLTRPLAEVRMNHNNDDLFEYFGYLNDWINPTSSAYTLYVKGPDGLNKSIGYEKIKEKMLTSQGDKYPNPVEMTFAWDGHVIHTRQDHFCQTGDDPYCYANGWMKNQNAELNPSVFDDLDKFMVFAEKQCRAMHERYNFSHEEITMASHLQETNAMYEMADNACDKAETKGPLPTDRDFAKHSYVKCLMNYAAIEIPYCYFRGCALEGDRIGHGSECDY